MNDLIEALQIFSKYTNSHNPTHCEHDTLYVCVNPEIVSQEDKNKLEILSFWAEDDLFSSNRFGSC